LDGCLGTRAAVTSSARSISTKPSCRPPRSLTGEGALRQCQPGPCSPPPLPPRHPPSGPRVGCAQAVPAWPVLASPAAAPPPTLRAARRLRSGTDNLDARLLEAVQYGRLGTGIGDQRVDPVDRTDPGERVSAQLGAVRDDHHAP